ncbi:MAG: UDP-3-O-acyl-N-acetylglucosamine deacetylase [Planctomycetes bacterium]|nr:UDP-3-O-acyl-N-acetylglucosamine deacetylase [Planctomycetota bacterium]
MSTDTQTTIAAPVSLSGLGLFSGTPVTVTFKPAQPNHGIVFVRTDLNNKPVPALVQHVLKRARRTALRNGDALIETCEHCLSACSGLGVDNLVIEISAAELPGLDGSSLPYVEAIRSVGLKTSDVERHRLVITEPVILRQDDAYIAAVPSNDKGAQLVYEVDYGRGSVIGHQVATFDTATGDYAAQIAPARTFVLEAEAQALRQAGLGKHLTPADVVVFGKEGPLGGNKLRFTDEPSRHKLLDLMGDLYLLGAPIQGRIVAYKSGHWLNQSLARQLVRQFRAQTRGQLALHRNVMDIRKLIRMMPHRYPFLLVDRVIELDGDRRAVGIKNVTINEPFFQGHFPGTPLMPGVLIVEAMAQLSGVLVGQKPENTGKLAVLTSLDRVKLRRAVTPGDQLIIEAESVRVKRGLAHMRCRAYVGEDLAAEAEIKFMLVDNEQPAE